MAGGALVARGVAAVGVVNIFVGFRVLPQGEDAVGIFRQTLPQRIYFSLWGSDTLIDWMGPFAEPAGPLDMQVDWVAYTAPGDKCQFPESIACTLN